MSVQAEKGLQEICKVHASNQVKCEMTMYCQQLAKIQMKSDEEIAKEMQMQYDKEYDILKYIEGNANGSTIASGITDNTVNTGFSEDEFEDMSNAESERLYSILEKYDPVPAFNYRLHDRRRVCNDNSDFRIKNNNGQFKRAEKNLNVPDKQHIHERQITVSYGVDDVSRKALYKMMDEGILDQTNNVIYFGKKTILLHIKTNPQSQLPSECALMIFKPPEHNNLGRRGNRKLLHMFAEKEVRILQRLRRAGVLCPTVYGLKGHAILISFLGRNGRLAPNIKDATICEAKLTVAYSEVIHYIQVMYDECKLIHGHLSKHNILWFNSNCYMLEVFQCVETTHENAFHLLYKDCDVISKLFMKKGVPDVATPVELFKNITGVEYADIKVKKKLTSFEKSENLKIETQRNVAMDESESLELCN